MQSSSPAIMNNSRLLLLLAILFLFISSNITSSSDAVVSDTLRPNQTLRDGQSLVSANQSFELGFFSPQGSTNRYVGIWYHNISVQTVVWVGNRDRPVADASGVISFDSYGNLRIVDARGSSFVFTYGFSSTESTAAKLLDNGNLVLMDANNSSQILYESFDYPTDSFLPGMKLGLVRGQNRLLTSWRNSGDPATGDFLFGVNPNSSGHQQMYIWQKNTIYWDSGPWNGQIFSLRPEMFSLNSSEYMHVLSPEDDYLTYSTKNTSIIPRYAMNFSGRIQLQLWSEAAQEWLILWSQPRPQCDVYNLCGDNGVCDEESVPDGQCSCLRGFAPALESLADWNISVTKPGCLVRKSSLQCSRTGDKNGYLTMPNTIKDRFLWIDVNLPADPQYLNVSSAAECQSSCLSNCNCTAYAFTNMCQLWYGNLKDLKKVNGAAAGLYLRLAPSEFPGKANAAID